MGRALSIAGALLAVTLPTTAHAHPTELRDAMIGYGDRFADASGAWEFVDVAWNADNDWHAVGTLSFIQGDDDGYFEFTMEIAADRCIGGGIVTATPLGDGGRCPGRLAYEYPRHAKSPSGRTAAGRRYGRRIEKRSTHRK